MDIQECITFYAIGLITTYSGDLPGHEFRGNQYQDVADNAKLLSARAERRSVVASNSGGDEDSIRARKQFSAAKAHDDAATAPFKAKRLAVESGHPDLAEEHSIKVRYHVEKSDYHKGAY